jgi:hypothetical protein
MRIVALIFMVLVVSCAPRPESRTISKAGVVLEPARSAAPPTLGATSSSGHPTGQSAMLGVNVAMRGTNAVFQVMFECGERPMAPHDIYVSDPGYQGFEPRIHCLLRDDPAPGSRPNYFRDWEWEYGTKVSGYQLKGTCEPLERDRKYDVEVSGPGVGGAIFAINQDGTIRVYEDDCQRVKNRKGTNP